MKKLNSILLSLLLTTMFNAYAAFTPEAGEKYYIIQDAGTGQFVLGGPTNTQPKVVAAENVPTQLFEFISTGAADTYYIKNEAGVYLSKNASSGWNTAYEAEPNGTNSEWVISGDNFNNIRLKVVAKSYLAADAIANNSNLYCDKAIDNANGKFKLIKASDVYKNGIIDGGFENATAPSAPMGTWINDLNKLMGTGYDNGASRTRTVTGKNIVGNNCLYITYRQYDKNGYNAISNGIAGLVKGATYKFSFKYIQDGTDDHLADVYAATTANAAIIDAIDGNKYTTNLEAKNSVQQGTFSFVAPSETCYIVFRNQQGGVSTEFNLYIDDLSIEKTADPVASIMLSENAISFDQAVREKTFTVSGVLLSEDIILTAPAGTIVVPDTLSADADNELVTVYFTGYESFAGNLTLNSSSTTETVAVSANIDSPSLSEKELATGTSGIISLLTNSKKIVAATDVRDMTTVELGASFPENYTIEVKAKINSSEGRGLDLELRNEDKSGFRMAVNDKKVYDFGVCNLPTQFVMDAIGNDYHTYRYVVEDTKVHVYIDGNYYTSTNIIADMKPNNLFDNGGFELDGLTGWTNPTGWGRNRATDFSFSGTSSLDLQAWHGSNTLVTQYTQPLEAGDYKISFQYIKRYGSQQYRWGLATVANANVNSGDNFLTGPWNNLGVTSWSLQSHEFTLNDRVEELSLYFIEWNSGAGIAVDDIELVKKEEATITPYISFGKAFGKGAADIDVEYINYDLSGAYKPSNTSTSIDENIANPASFSYSDGKIYVQNANNETLNIYSATGKLVLSKVVSGSESVSVNIESGFYIAQLGYKAIKFIK